MMFTPDPSMPIRTHLSSLKSQADCHWKVTEFAAEAVEMVA